VVDLCRVPVDLCRVPVDLCRVPVDLFDVPVERDRLAPCERLDDVVGLCCSEDGLCRSEEPEPK
jgi:hypothetical protein